MSNDVIRPDERAVGDSAVVRQVTPRPRFPVCLRRHRMSSQYLSGSGVQAVAAILVSHQ